MSMKKKLRKAYENAAPDVWGRVAQACVEQEPPAQTVAPSHRFAHGRFPHWLTETIGTAAAVVFLIGVIGGAAWLMTGNGGPNSGVDPTEQTNLPTETTRPVETTEPTQTLPPTESTAPTTEATTEPTTEPTEPDNSLLQAYDAWMAYMKGDMTCWPIRYEGDELPANPVFDGLRDDQLQEGCFYLIFSEDDTYIRHILISEEQADVFVNTSEHVYFTLEDAYPRVYRTDLEGKDKTVIYESEANRIGFMRYYGTDANGVLLICEQDFGMDRIVSFDLATGEKKVLMEAWEIEQFYFTPTSLMEDNVVVHISNSELGATIYWKGKLNASDPENPIGDTYYYIVESDAHWDVSDWKVKPLKKWIPTPFGAPFVYDSSYSVDDEADVSECVEGWLYYCDYATHKVHFVSKEKVIAKNSNDTHVFFVTEAEPTKIYAAPLTDLTKHELIYESTFGEICKDFGPGSHQYYNTALAFITDNKRFVWLDLTTGEAEVLMEQYDIVTACVDTGNDFVVDGVPYLKDLNVIWFVGRLEEGDELQQYFYYRDTGEIKIDNSQ